MKKNPFLTQHSKPNDLKAAVSSSAVRDKNNNLPASGFPFVPPQVNGLFDGAFTLRWPGRPGEGSGAESTAAAPAALPLPGVS